MSIESSQPIIDRLLGEFEIWREENENGSVEEFISSQSISGEIAVVFVAHLKREEGLHELVQDVRLGGDTRPAPEFAEHSGKRLGNYKLLRKLGEGGMGEVWMADQTEPVKRRVALKVIRASLLESSEKEGFARFNAERQALAMMNHENIAKVLDAGTTEDNQPYFALELVNGIPITKYCDDSRLTIRERLSLMIPVCNAIQHAHQKGIIHRDIKPSNVLVEIIDGKPVPRVIDFGLAKALDHHRQLTDESLQTEFGQVIGTLQYMSPEQAEFSELDLDTRTDIYSLGVMLYELLTGSTPLATDTAKNNALITVLKQIKDTDPPRPSVRLSDSADRIENISNLRRIDPLRLKRILAGDLDWIVLKALEKDRVRRYESASGLSADIERYLNDDPVVARPPSFGYRLKKSIRKNRAVYGFGVVIAILLFASSIVAGAFALWAINERNQRDQLADDYKTTLLEIVTIENQTRILLDHPELKSKRLEAFRSQMLNQGIEYYESLVIKLETVGEDDPQIIRTIADSYAEIGKIAIEMNRTDRAEQAYMKSLELRKGLYDSALSDVKNQVDLANNEYNLGLVFRASGDSQTGMTHSRRSFELIEAAAADHPDNEDVLEQLFLSRVGLGTLLMESGDQQAAESLLKEAVDYAESRISDQITAPPTVIRMLIGSIVNLGNRYSNSMQYDQAIEMHTRALELAKQIDRGFPDDAGFREMLATGHRNFAALHHRIYQTSRGANVAGYTPEELLTTVKENYRNAKEILLSLMEEYPYAPEYKRLYASVCSGYGLIFLDSHNHEMARSEFELGIEYINKALYDNPDDLEYLDTKAQILGNLGGLYGTLGELEPARETMAETTELFEKLAEANPTNLAYQIFLAGTYGNVGLVDQQLGQYESAIEWAQKSIDAANELDKKVPNHPSIVLYLSNGYENMALSQLKLREYEMSYESIKLAKNVGVPRLQKKFLAFELGVLAELGRLDDATKLFNELYETFPLDPLASHTFAFSASRFLDKLHDDDADSGIAKQVALAGIDALKVAQAAGVIESLKFAGESEDLQGLAETKEYQNAVSDQ